MGDFIQARERFIHKNELFMSLSFVNQRIMVDPGHKLGLKEKTGNINYSNQNAECYILFHFGRER